MAQVSFTSFYNGPTAVYPSSTGLVDGITGAPQLGGDFRVGNYCDLTESDAKVWNAQYGTTLHEGRYRIVRLSTAATAANTGLGKPVAIARGTTVQQVALAAGGSGYTNGTYTISSSTSGGTQVATATVTVTGGAITSAAILFGGAGFTSVPTFSLSELSGGTGGSVLAQVTETANTVTTFDASAAHLSDVRGVFLGSVSASQVSAGSCVIIQELGIAPVLVTTATNTAAGSVATAASGAGITTTAPTAAGVAGFLGYTLDLAAANTLVRVALRTPVLQG